MAWILTIDVDAEHVDTVSDQLWGIGTNGIAEVATPDGDTAIVRLLAGFETEPDAKAARSEFGGSVAPVDPTVWGAPDTASIEVGGRSLTIEAGHSFGHGAHPTTQLCLQSLERHVTPGATVLDVGCGSGVLALAAKMLGAGAVTAVDIDPAAIAASTANALVNDIDIQVSTTPVSDLTGPFHLVVINMLVAELEALVPDVQRLTGGLIILSGALSGQADRWSAMFPSTTLIEETTNGDWAGRVLRTNA